MQLAKKKMIYSFPPKWLLVIYGHPCTGKTTLSRKLSKILEIPVLSKDEIKEVLFDKLGIGDREHSKIFGAASISILFKILDSFMLSGKSIIVESNFNSTVSANDIRNLLIKNSYTPLELLCFSNGQVLAKRFEIRSNSSERHPGHNDSGNLKEFEEILSNGRAERLNLGGPFLEVDTTSFENIRENDVAHELLKRANCI